MQRVVVLGRGGAGKSTAAVRLGQITGLPVIELDKHFWSADLRPLSGEEWARVTRDLATRPSWVMDGDLGPHDVLAPRLQRADFWWWVVTWRRRSRPVLLRAIAEHAPTAGCHVVRKPRELTSWFSRLEP